MSRGEQGKEARGAPAKGTSAGATQQLPRGAGQQKSGQQKSGQRKSDQQKSGQGAGGTGRGAASSGTSRPTSGAATGRPAAGGRTSRTGTRAPGRSAPRRVKLTVSRVDPWSVMKISFLLSVAIGIAFVVVVAVLWMLISGMGLFADINSMITDLTQTESSSGSFDLMDYVGFGRVVSLSVVLGVVDIILMTAMATLGAFLYNICASLVGGLQMTLSDD